MLKLFGHGWNRKKMSRFHAASLFRLHRQGDVDLFEFEAVLNSVAGPGGSDEEAQEAEAGDLRLSAGVPNVFWGVPKIGIPQIIQN